MIRSLLLAASAIAGVLTTTLATRIGTVSSASKSPFLTWNTKKHTATLTLIEGYTSANHTLNFNGAIAGGMVVSVPKSYKVTVNFSNKSSFPHSAVVTDYTVRSSEGAHPLAFRAASSLNPAAGTAPGATDQFSFTASRLGTYSIICEVGHHADAFMWDVLDVTRAQTPSITIYAPLNPQSTATAAP